MARLYDKSLTLLDLSTGTVRELGEGFGARFSPDGRYMVIPGYPEDRVLALPSFESVLSLRVAGPASVFSRDSRKVALLEDDVVHICDLATKSLDCTLPTHLDNVTDGYSSSDLEFTPDGSKIVTAGSDHYRYWVVVWDLATEEHLVEIKDDGGWVNIAISPDGKLLALESTSSQKPRVRVHNTKDGALIGELYGVPAFVEAMAFAPQESTLALGLSNGTVEVWDAATRSRKHILSIGEDKMIQAVAFSADGREVVAASRDGDVAMWSTSNAALLRRASMPRSGWETGGNHWLTLALLALVWVGVWFAAKLRFAVPSRAAQPAPRHGWMLVAGVVVGWQVLAFAVFLGSPWGFGTLRSCSSSICCWWPPWSLPVSPGLPCACGFAWQAGWQRR